MARPGIMLYFDMLEPIRVLPDADKGRLLVAMLEYGKDGTLPQFEGMLALAWGFVLPKLDRDEESYEKAMQQRKYAGFCKSRASKNLPKISFEDWSLMGDTERERAVSGGIGPMFPITDDTGSHPTTTSAATATPATATKTTSISTAAAAATGTPTEPEFAATAAAKKSDSLFLGGALGKGVVLLSEEQIGSLLDIMGLDAFDFYVDKLSSFIIKNDAKVKSHYETLLKWWREDRSVEKMGNEEAVPTGDSGVQGVTDMEALAQQMAEV